MIDNKLFSTFKLDNTEKKVFNLIQKHGPVTKNNLVSLTSLPLTTLNRVMDKLSSQTLITKSGIDLSSGGRRPGLYGVNPDRFFCIGIDISRTYSNIIAVNLKLDVLAKHHFVMDTHHSPEYTAALIAEAYNNLVKKAGLNKEMCLGAGLGTVGPMNKERSIMLAPSNFLSNGWDKDIRIKELLEQVLLLPVLVENGADTAALAEYYYGAGKPYSSLSYLNCAIGIRCGAIVSGQLIRGINQGEDSFGHMIVEHNGEKCFCGNKGCIEAYASLIKLKEKYILETKHDVSFDHICQLADKKDPSAYRIISSAALMFGTGLSNYIGLLNPQVIILSGPLISSSTLFYDSCIHRIKQVHSSKKTPLPVFFKFGKYKDDAMAVGAAANVIESLIRES